MKFTNPFKNGKMENPGVNRDVSRKRSADKLKNIKLMPESKKSSIVKKDTF